MSDLDPRALNQALAEIGDAVFVTDAGGLITFVNRAFTTLYGYQAGEIVGQPAARLGPEAGGGDDFRGPVTHRSDDARELALGLSRASVRDDGGRVIARVHVARAAGALQRLEDALRRAQDELAAQRAALQELAIRDELTGLYNHREMLRLLGEEVARSRRYKRPLSLLLIDVDDLDRVNAEHSHALGDDVLRSVAAMLRNHLRPVDRSARYGGAELGVILPDTFAGDGVQVAERLRGLVGAATFTAFADGVLEKTARVSISVGVAGVHESHDGPEELIRAAARALREAKQRGRNNVVAFVDLRVGPLG